MKDTLQWLTILLPLVCLYFYGLYRIPKDRAENTQKHVKGLTSSGETGHAKASLQ